MYVYVPGTCVRMCSCRLELAQQGICACRQLVCVSGRWALRAMKSVPIFFLRQNWPLAVARSRGCGNLGTGSNRLLGLSGCTREPAARET